MWNGGVQKWICFIVIFLRIVIYVHIFNLGVCSGSEYTDCPSGCSCSNVKKLGTAEDGSGDGLKTGAVTAARRKVVCVGKADSAYILLNSVEELKPISSPLDILYLDLSDNRITSLKKDSFLELQNLKRLNLSNNNIITIEPGAFNGLKNLQRLDLSVNKLNSLNSSIFSGLESLERIYIGGNSITTLTAGTFNNLPQLKRLYLGTEQLRCDCHLQWISTFLQDNTDVRLINSTCASPVLLKSKPIRDFKEKELHCDWPLELDNFQLTPATSQIVFQGDTLPFECKASLRENYKPGLAWYRMGHPVRTNKSVGVYVHTAEVPDSHSVISSLMLEKLSVQDSGVWKCLAHTIYGNKSLAVNIVVIPYDAVICPDVVTHTNRGTFIWKRGLSATTPSLPCPHSSSHLFHNGNQVSSLGYYSCNRAGQWENLDVSACPYASEVTRILQQSAEEKVNKTLLEIQAMGLKSTINHPRNITDKDDVKFIAQIMERLLDNMGPENFKQLNGVMLHLASVLMDVNSSILYDAQSDYNACSRIITVLEKIPNRQLESKKTVTGVSQNIAFYAYSVLQDDFAGLTCHSYSVPGSGGYTTSSFQCDTAPDADINADGNHLESDRRNNLEASIYIPSKIFEFVKCLYNVCDHNIPFKIEVIVYRKATLFQQKMRNPSRIIPTAVISAKIVQANEVQHVENTSVPIVINLKMMSRNQVGAPKTTAPMAVYWDDSINDGFGGWLPHGCKIVEEDNSMSTVHCRHLTNFAISRAVVPAVTDDWLARTFNMSPMVYAGSIILVLSVLTTAITYMVCHSSMQMPKKLRHCIPNLCLAIICLCVTYTVGVRETERDMFCKIIGISIHYFSLCVLFWTDITSYVMYKKFQKSRLPPKPPDPDAPVKPVLGIYLLGWGLALILCGIVAAINSLQHYDNAHYCFLLTGARRYAFYVPAGCLVLINIAFFICICCAVWGIDTNNRQQGSAIDEPETEEIQIIDDGDYMTNIDSITPTSTNMDSVKPAMAVTCRNPSHLSNLTTSNNSQYSSTMDLQYKPWTQLRGMVVFLVLFMLTWSMGALAVALPFDFIHQEIVFNCLYLVCSFLFGMFIIVFFVFGRADGKENWRRTCCCVKSEEYDVNGSNTSYHSNSLRLTNGHLGQSDISLEGSQYTNKSCNGNSRPVNNYRYGPISPLERGSELSILNSNPPSILESSLGGVPEYPNFYNAKQNGIAKKYWQKNRQQSRIAQLNRDLKKNKFVRPKDGNSRVSFDDSSDQNTHISLEIQLDPHGAFISNGGGRVHPANFYNNTSAGPYGINIDGPKNGRTPPLLVPYERYQMAPISGVSSPPSTTVLLPPDGGSFISTDISSPVVPPAPMTSPQSSGINYIPPSSSHFHHFNHHSLPRQFKAAVVNANAAAVPVSQYMQRNGSVPRLRDFDGKSSTSRDTRPLSIGSDSQAVESHLRYGSSSSNNKHKDIGNSSFNNHNRSRSGGGGGYISGNSNTSNGSKSARKRGNITGKSTSKNNVGDGVATQTAVYHQSVPPHNYHHHRLSDGSEKGQNISYPLRVDTFPGNQIAIQANINNNSSQEDHDNVNDHQNLNAMNFQRQQQISPSSKCYLPQLSDDWSHPHHHNFQHQQIPYITSVRPPINNMNDPNRAMYVHPVYQEEELQKQIQQPTFETDNRVNNNNFVTSDNCYSSAKPPVMPKHRKNSSDGVSSKKLNTKCGSDVKTADFDVDLPQGKPKLCKLEGNHPKHHKRKSGGSSSPIDEEHLLVITNINNVTNDIKLLLHDGSQQTDIINENSIHMHSNSDNHPNSTKNSIAISQSGSHGNISGSHSNITADDNNEEEALNCDSNNLSAILHRINLDSEGNDPEVEGLMSSYPSLRSHNDEEEMDLVNGFTNEDCSGGEASSCSDIWLPQRPSVAKLKNMETCV